MLPDTLRFTSSAVMAALVLLLPSCHKPSQQQMAAADPDFDATEPHPFAQRSCDNGEVLSASDCRLHGDTLGVLIISEAVFDSITHMVRSLHFSDCNDSVNGSVECQYNEFWELTDLYVEMPHQRTHTVLSWDDNGNISTINHETWQTSDTPASTQHRMMNLQLGDYGRQSAFSNWYGGIAELMGGPVAIAFHAGLMGRAPWFLPQTIQVVNSEIVDEMIGTQKSYTFRPRYKYDPNGCLSSETYIDLADASQRTYTYTY